MKHKLGTILVVLTAIIALLFMGYPAHSYVSHMVLMIMLCVGVLLRRSS